MLIEHEREKLLNAIIYFLKNTRNCGVTKLLKLLYFLDFMHFRETGKSVTGLEYHAWDRGPVPTKLYGEIKNPPPDLKERVFIPSFKDDRSFIAMQARKPFDNKFFTKRELRILKEVAEIFRDARTEDMVEASHLPNHPWDRTLHAKGRMAKIDYMLALDDTDRSLSADEVNERIRDREQIKKAFVR
jgi:uncharacterized phage-associated protein